MVMPRSGAGTVCNLAADGQLTAPHGFWQPMDSCATVCTEISGLRETPWKVGDATDPFGQRWVLTGHTGFGQLAAALAAAAGCPGLDLCLEARAGSQSDEFSPPGEGWLDNSDLADLEALRRLVLKFSRRWYCT